MSSSTKTSAEARTRAESKFHLAERRKSDADLALSEVRAAQAAENQKTMRLKALRLAKEEADRAAAAAHAPAVKAPAKRGAPAKRKARAAVTG